MTTLIEKIEIENIPLDQLMLKNYYYQKQGLKYLKSHFNILDPKFGTVSLYTYGIASH